ncbi:DinB family protein [Chitinophaga vietnamensis]|uniref:DinB family protein n=1 Tax=Chitinophaga vietnamensis TaxID=2593957 RepID=UPI0011783764|nr:DinB family protein [Chitinophaga vietnamensis]
MITFLKETLWKQFGASIDMLGNAIAMYPDEHWDTRRRFFYIAYHTLIFLDYYLSYPAQALSSPLSFTLCAESAIPAEAVDDIVPNRIYTKKELLAYLQSSREKCHQLIMSLNPEILADKWIEIDGDKTFAMLELLLYNMRHVQHHAGQLNMMLRQAIGAAPDWVPAAKE